MRDRYGPWAVVLGASEGTGAEFARQLAAAGLDVVLVARNASRLEMLADEVRAQHGVHAIVTPLDLTVDDAVERVKQVTEDLQIGCFVMNAGSDDHGTRFLDTPVGDWTALARRNVLVPIELCHHFGRPMRDRGRGALVLVSSGAGWAGGGRMAIYSSTKAFDRTFAEALWAELRPTGVDVLTLVLATTDTPALRRLLDRTGLPAPVLADPVEAVRLGLANLANGPALVFGEGGVVDTDTAATRRQFAEMMTAGTAMFFGSD